MKSHISYIRPFFYEGDKFILVLLKTLLNIIFLIVIHFSFIAAGISSPEQELLTRYLLSRILEKDDLSYSEDTRDKSQDRIGERRDDQDSAPSIVYPQVSQQVKLLSTFSNSIIEYILFSVNHSAIETSSSKSQRKY